MKKSSKKIIALKKKLEPAIVSKTIKSITKLIFFDLQIN